MKVELDKVRLSMSALTEEIFVGTLSNDGKSFKHKKNITNDFIKALIDWGGGYRRTITAGDKKWEVTVKELKGKGK